MAKVAGIYNLQASLASITSTFTFQNSSQDKIITLSSDSVLNVRCLSANTEIYNVDVSFLTNNVLKIKKARIVTTGAEGLRTGLGKNACELRLWALSDKNDTSSKIGVFSINLKNFNEWQDVNVNFIPSSNATKDYYLMAASVFTKLALEDYNIQDEYLGLSFVPFLEFQVDTAGILINGRDLV